jgi:hypothetical protein
MMFASRKACWPAAHEALRAVGGGRGAGGAAIVYRELYPMHLLIVVLIWSSIYTSWSVMGRFGLVSLGHGGFMGIGAYVTALLWNNSASRRGSASVAMVVVAIVAIIAWPCFRFRIIGHYFAGHAGVERHRCRSSPRRARSPAVRSVTRRSATTGVRSSRAVHRQGDMVLIALGVWGSGCSSATASIAACCATRWRRSPKTRTRGGGGRT